MYNHNGDDFMIVYWDMLFLINFFMDYLTIYTSSKLSGIYSSKIKTGIAALIGGVYGIFMFENSFMGLIGIFVSVLMIYIAFSHINVKLVLIFYCNLFLLGGIAMCLNTLFSYAKRIEYMIYTENVLWLTLIGSTISVFLICCLFKIFKRNIIKERQIQKILVSFEGRNIIIAGLMDTGNLLLDPVTGYPVILVFYEKIKEILPDSLKLFLSEDGDLTTLLNIKYKNKIRLIPYKTAGNESVLKGFRPDYIILNDDGKRVIKDIVIAVVYKQMSANNEFEAVLNPQL